MTTAPPDCATTVSGKVTEVVPGGVRAPAEVPLVLSVGPSAPLPLGPCSAAPVAPVAATPPILLVPTAPPQESISTAKAIVRETPAHLRARARRWFERATAIAAAQSRQRMNARAGTMFVGPRS